MQLIFQKATIQTLGEKLNYCWFSFFLFFCFSNLSANGILTLKFNKIHLVLVMPNFSSE